MRSESRRESHGKDSGMRQGRPVEWVQARRKGATVEEVLQKAGEHAQEHGIRQVTPELIEKVKANIRDA